MDFGWKCSTPTAPDISKIVVRCQQKVANFFEYAKMRGMEVCDMDNKELCKLRLNEAMRDIDITAQELADRSGINKLLIWRSVVYLQMLANTGFLEFECSKKSRYCDPCTCRRYCRKFDEKTRYKCDVEAVKNSVYIF